MEENQLRLAITELINKYLTEKTKNPNVEANSIYIRKALDQRIGQYFPKSLLNELLVELGFQYRINNGTDYYFNISQNNLRILYSSYSILKTISKHNNYSFSDLVKVHRFKNVDLYKYTFKYLIRCNFKSAFLEKNYTERDVYKVIANELGISTYLATEYIDTLNIPEFAGMPEEILSKLLKLFQRKPSECLTDENYQRS